ncbi:ATP-grasp fold amidoligase family protein [Microbacterium sp. OR16]|uniref:ATP-grasp fold amidoligase family protein n=1 Tax=Microbacterium sp. OR16 TaxID=3095345 RepID=UPI0039B5FBE9
MSFSSLIRRLIAALPAPAARRLLYLHRFHRFPNTRFPRTFQEKLNVRILRDRRMLLVEASSKVLSKEYASSKNIPGLRIPRTYWHGRNIGDMHGRELDFNWVLKPSHRSGGVELGLRGKFDVSALRYAPEKLLREREYRTSKLWAYREAPRELLLEERIGGPEESLSDYKFFVFDGRVQMIQLDSGRFGSHTRVLYTREWVPRPEAFGVPRGTPQAPPPILTKLLDIAEALGEDFDFVRVDLYVWEGEVYFGELTVYPGGGLSPWPEKLDAEMGSHWILPQSLTSSPER